MAFLFRVPIMVYCLHSCMPLCLHPSCHWSATQLCSPVLCLFLDYFDRCLFLGRLVAIKSKLRFPRTLISSSPLIFYWFWLSPMMDSCSLMNTSHGIVLLKYVQKLDSPLRCGISFSRKSYRYSSSYPPHFFWHLDTFLNLDMSLFASLLYNCWLMASTGLLQMVWGYIAIF